jgi:hypothetical protein
MKGIQGFAGGFSGGLDQGLGIMRSFRDEKRQNEAFELQKRQAEQGMELARNADGRAASAEGRAQTAFEGQQEDRKWTNENVRPLSLQQLKLTVDKYEQDIELGGVELATRNLQLEWMPEDRERRQMFEDRADARQERQEDRADRSQTFSEYLGRANLDISRRSQNRMEEAQDFQQAAQLLPVYTSLVERGLPIPPKMQSVMQNSPFGITNMVENAEASANFAPILGMAAKGDFSFMGNPEMRASAYALSRSVGMRIAREKGMEAGSARVVDLSPAKGGGLWVKVTAYDPKSGTYKTLTHGVSADHLAGQMQLNARTGEALKNHPSYRHLANHAGLGRAYQGDIMKAAKDDWFKLQKVHSNTVDQSIDINDPRRRKAEAWLARYPDPDSYAQDMAHAAAATRGARGADLSRTDANRTFATVARYTGIMDHDQAMTRANGALRIINQLADKPKGSIPALAAKAKELGVNWSDPASKVRFFYEINNDPKLRQELGRVLRGGGQGAANPSQGAGNARLILNAGQVGASIFGAANITQNRRDPNSDLGKKNPNSYHVRSGAAIDVRPIRGMTFEQAKAAIIARGYKIVEALNEVGAGRSRHATGDHWHFVIGT